MSWGKGKFRRHPEGAELLGVWRKGAWASGWPLFRHSQQSHKGLQGCRGPDGHRVGAFVLAQVAGTQEGLGAVGAGVGAHRAVGAAVLAQPSPV